MSKISLPALVLALAVVAISVLLATLMPSERDRNARTAVEGGTDGVVAAVEAPVDGLGRWIVMLGEVELRVPKDRRSQPPANTTYDIYPEALCLRQEEELADCFELPDRIRIFLMAQPLETPQPECNIDREYSDGVLNGPFATANAEVELYRSESGTTRRYVYRKAGEACRYSTARCNATNCISSFIPHSGIFVRYQFDESAMGSWPTIHRRVRDHVTPLYAWR